MLQRTPLVHREGLRNRFLLPVFLPMPKQATSSREPQPSRSVSPPLRPRDDLVAACSTDPYDAPGVLAWTAVELQREERLDADVHQRSSQPGQVAESEDGAIGAPC